MNILVVQIYQTSVPANLIQLSGARIFGGVWGLVGGGGIPPPKMFGWDQAFGFLGN